MSTATYTSLHFAGTESVQVNRGDNNDALIFADPGRVAPLTIVLAHYNGTDRNADFLRRLAAAASELADDLTIGGAA